MIYWGSRNEPGDRSAPTGGYVSIPTLVRLSETPVPHMAPTSLVHPHGVRSAKLAANAGVGSGTFSRTNRSKESQRARR